jgi:hypothetical protein
MGSQPHSNQKGPPKAVSFGANGGVNGEKSGQDSRTLRRTSTGVQGCVLLCVSCIMQLHGRGLHTVELHSGAPTADISSWLPTVHRKHVRWICRQPG